MADKMKVMGKGYASPISFEVDLEPLKKIFVDVLEQQKDTDDKMMRGIKEYMSDAVESETVFIEGHKTSHYLYRLYEYIKDSFNLDETMDYSWRRETEVPPSKYNFEVKRGEKMVLIYKGLLFISSKENPDEKYVIWMTPYDEDLGLEMEIFYDGEREQFKARKDSFLESFNENHPLKNEIVDSKWKYLDVKNVGWSEIIVSDEQRKIINRNIINFIKNLSMYKENRLPTSRGVLITGPPGTGKTLCCEVIVNDLDCSTIYVSTDSVSEVGDIKKVYSLARKISPCLVIVEDIDTLGGLDRTVRGGEHPLLGEFLNCLAGMGDNDGVITIATTNYAEHLDAALADRPGRFDVRLNFDLPNAELRKHILDKYLKDLGVKVKLNGIVDKTEGLSGAYLKEIVMTAYMISTEKDEKVNKDTLNEAIDEILLLKGKVNPNFNQKKTSTNNLYG